MRVNFSHFTPVWMVFLAIFGLSCSSNQNTITGDVFHNTTAHYNGYFYAREKATEVEGTILKSLDDDPSLILTLFPKLDTTLAKSYKKDTEEIIKMASISIQRHPNSRWVDDNYLMVGRARMYDCDFQNAIQTFKYVNTKSTDPDLRHQALLFLIRTFTEQKEFEKAEETADYLDKEKLSRENAKNFYLQRAYLYQNQQNWDKMVRNLTLADSLLTRADRRGRIYFIIGQVYQKLGFSSEAYNYYRRCLGTNPDYEIDFYARLNMAQVARLDNSKNVRNIRKQFEKLLDDTKNAEFKDKIYYEVGEFERKQGNLVEALDQYKLSAHAGKNKRIQGSAFLRVGQIYFDSLRKFTLAKLYYDSAMASLPKEYEDYESLKKRHAILGDFAKYTETINWQDSLLQMATLDSATLRSRIDSIFAAREKKLDGKQKKKKRAAQANNESNSSFFQRESTSTTDWYFGNPSAVSSGQSEFQRIWGSIPLEDNWRRSNKSAQQDVASTGETQSTTPTLTANAASSGVKTSSPADQAADKIFQELPKTDKQKKESLALIEEAYFKLGDLYYFQLQEKENAETTYKQLLNRFPQSNYTPEVLYKLYLIHRERGDAEADVIAAQMKQDYPNSTFTKILINPDYIKETTITTEKQKIIYRDAYADYQKNNLRGAQEKLKTARSLGETAFLAQIDLLQIMITGKSEDVTRYQFELDEYIKKYPDASTRPFADNLIAGAKSFIANVERRNGIRFGVSFDEEHYLVIVHKVNDQASESITKRMEAFNKRATAAKLELTNLILNDEWSMTFIGNLKDKAEAISFYNRFIGEVASSPPFSTLNFHTFVITKENFNIFYRNKALDEYLSFFDRYYPEKIK